jgi:uncharacterized protein
MKLHEHRQAQMNLISRYGASEIVINAQLLQAPLIVAPGFVHGSWISSVDDLTLESLQPVWPLQPRILLLGSDRGATAVRALRPLLAARQVALEAMDLGAACRTYNVLAQEDRPVVALLFP